MNGKPDNQDPSSPPTNPDLVGTPWAKDSHFTLGSANQSITQKMQNSRTVELHDYFGELIRDEFGGWTGNLLFPPTKKPVQIFIPGGKMDLTVPPECVSFIEEVILLYPEISKAIQEHFYKLSDEFEDLKSMDDVWSIFQLEGIHLDVGALINSKSWRLIYGTDYGGHIFEFEMNGKNFVEMSLEG